MKAGPMRLLRVTAAAVFAFGSGPAAAQNLLALCIGVTPEGRVVSPLFTLEDNHYGYRESGQHAEDVARYNERAKIPMPIGGYGPRTLSAQFDSYIKERFKGHRDAPCVLGTNREVMFSYYFELKTKGYSKVLVNDWRPSAGTALRAEEWPN